MTSLAPCHETPASPAARAATWLARGADALVRVMDFLERVAAGRRALRQLAAADDRMLKDMGLDRSDLRNAAAEPLYRDPTALLAGRAGETRRRRPRRARAERRNPSRYY